MVVHLGHQLYYQQTLITTEQVDLDMVLTPGLIVQYPGGTGEEVQENNMEKDTIVSNVVTMGAVGMTLMHTIEVLTILSLATAIGLNLIMIYRNLKDKE